VLSELLLACNGDSSLSPPLLHLLPSPPHTSTLPSPPHTSTLPSPPHTSTLPSPISSPFSCPYIPLPSPPLTSLSLLSALTQSTMDVRATAARLVSKIALCSTPDVFPSPKVSSSLFLLFLLFLSVLLVLTIHCPFRSGRM